MRAPFGRVALAASLLGAGAGPVGAQSAVSLFAGAASYDLSGTGTSAVLGGRYDREILARVELQGSLGYFWYRTQGDRRVGILLPEAGVLARPIAALPLYLGVGAGYALGIRGDPPDEPTLFGVLGLQIPAGSSWSLRPELRVRTVDPWVGTIADFALGVRRSIGG